MYKIKFKLILLIFIITTTLFSQWKSKEERDKWNKKVEDKWTLHPYKYVRDWKSTIEITNTQVYFINPYKSNRITGSKGTSLEFSKNSFILPPSFYEGSRLQIILTEVLVPLDYYLANLNLSQTLNGKTTLFKSGGMFRIQVFFNNKAIKIKYPGIKVSFPVIDNEQYNVYKLTNNKWHKEYNSENIETDDGNCEDENNYSENCENNNLSNKIIRNIVSIDWWNFDKEEVKTVCIEGSIKAATKNFHITALGIKPRGMITTFSNKPYYKIKFLPKAKGKIIIESDNNYIGVSNEFTSPTISSRTSKGNVDNCKKLPPIHLKKISKTNRKNRKKVLKLLGLKDVI